MKTGRLLEENEGTTVLCNEIPHVDWDAILNNKPVSLPTLMKLLVAIVDYLQTHPFFLFQHLIRIPYHLSCDDHFQIKYDFADFSFGIFIRHDLRFSNYESIRLENNFSLIVDQILDFEMNPELEMVAIDCSPQAPPNYHFSELVVHSLIHQDFVISEGSKLGKWKILSLENKAKFVPLKLPEHIMSKLIRKKAFLKTFSLRKDLSDSLSRLLLLKKNDIQTLTEGGLHDTQSKQL